MSVKENHKIFLLAIILEKAHPDAVKYKNHVIDKVALTSWRSRRAIPASRDGLRQALEEMGIADAYYDLLSASSYIDPVRRDTLCDALDRRVVLLREVQSKR